MGQRGNVILIGTIILLAIVSRFAFLDLRPLHHDEGVNYFFAESIVSGEGWRYNPVNYHGPFYFFILALSFLIFGIGEFSLRFPAAVFGVLICILPLFLHLEKKEKIFACLFLLVSPSLFYYSRYSIHEGSFVFFSIISIYFFSLILEKKSLNYLPYFAGAIALLFTIKETIIILLLVFFALLIFNWRSVKGINYRDNFVIILFSLFIFVFIYVLFFTSFFSNIGGLRDSFSAFMPWVDRGITEIGHDKVFYYYLELLVHYGLPLVILGIIGLYFCYMEKRIFANSLFFWFILIFITYSFIPYKTPWLIINISAPLCLLSAISMQRIWKWNGKIAFVILIVSITYLGTYAFYLNFINYSGEENKFAYVHTGKDIFNLVGKIDEIYKEGDKILIVSEENEYWPLPFYLHGKNVNYLYKEGFSDFEDFEDYSIFILRDSVFNEEYFEEYLHERYELRGGVELELVWRKD